MLVCLSKCAPTWLRVRMTWGEGEKKENDKEIWGILKYLFLSFLREWWRGSYLTLSFFSDMDKTSQLSCLNLPQILCFFFSFRAHRISHGFKLMPDRCIDCKSQFLPFQIWIFFFVDLFNLILLYTLVLIHYPFKYRLVLISKKKLKILGHKNWENEPMSY